MHIDLLPKKAAQIRRAILDSIVNAGKGHVGGAFSCADILVALYHGGALRFDPRDPDWENRDRFIMSKGHSGIALFAVLADLGFFGIEELATVCQEGSRLGEHPDRNVPGVEIDSGSLGHGLGVGAGLALSAKKSGKEYATVVLLGDGECYEGTVWEALLFAAHHELSNLVAVIDRNHQITLNRTEECIRLEPMPDKLEAFGWDVKVVDGHDFGQLRSAFSDLRSRTSSKPLAVIANTIKGKGVSYMEGRLKWHHGMPTEEEILIARRELAEVA